MRTRRLSSLICFFLVVGCGSNLELGDNEGGSGGGADGGAGPPPSPECLGNSGSGGFLPEGGVDPATCAADCESAAVQVCHVDPTEANSDCSTLCSLPATQSQVTCLRSTSCPALVNALDGRSTICGFPNAGGGSVDPACCAEVCEYAAIVGCNVGTSTAKSECVTTLCSSSPNRSQLDCVQKVACSALVGALGGGSMVCGIAAPGG